MKKSPSMQLWRDVFEAADRALELEPAERRAFVERCLEVQPAVGAELKALIDGAAAASALENSAATFAAAFLHDTAADDTAYSARNIDGFVDDDALTFGAYSVIREVGSGGMGAVYLAERSDDQYRKQVALKVLPRWGGGIIGDFSGSSKSGRFLQHSTTRELRGSWMAVSPPTEFRGLRWSTSTDSQSTSIAMTCDCIDIYVINLDGTGLKKLTADSSAVAGLPDWSADGRRIAYASRRHGRPEIYVMNSDGSHPIRLTFNDSLDTQPAWSPDGRHIAFISTRDGDHEIYVMNADGSNQVRLTTNPGEDSYPSWSPDGRRIVFQRRVLGHAQVYVMNADGSNVKRLTDLSPVAFSGFPN